MKRLLPFIIISSLVLSSCAKAKDEEKDFSEFLKSETENSFYMVHTTEETNEETYSLVKIEIPNESLLQKEYSDKLSELSGMDYETLSEDEKLSYTLIERELNLKKSGVKYSLFEDILSVDDGVHLSFVSSLCDFEINNVSDIEKYLSLYSDTENYIKSVIDYEKKRSEAGISRHKNDAEIIVSDCISIAENPERIMAAFEKKIKNLGLSETQRKEFIKRHNDITKNVFVPSYKKLAREIEKLPTRDNGGICSLALGKEYYSHRISSLYGKEISPDEIIKNLDSDINYYEGIFLSTAADYPEIFYEDNFGIKEPYSQTEEILPDYLDKAGKNFPDAEKFVPQTEYTSILKYPVVYDKKNPLKVKISTVYTTNETMDYISADYFPGGAYREWYYNNNVSDEVRKSYKNESFDDGWDMYASYEMNRLVYGDTPSQLLMNSNSVFWVTVICRVDMGVNYEGWSDIDVDNFFREHNLSVPLAEYYYNLAIQKPFYYMSDYISFHEIIVLKEKIKSENGRSFDEKAFNEAVLKNAYLPLDIMGERVINDYEMLTAEDDIS